MIVVKSRLRLAVLGNPARHRAFTVRQRNLTKSSVVTNRASPGGKRQLYPGEPTWLLTTSFIRTMP